MQAKTGYHGRINSRGRAQSRKSFRKSPGLKYSKGRRSPKNKSRTRYRRVSFKGHKVSPRQMFRRFRSSSMTEDEQLFFALEMSRLAQEEDDLRHALSESQREADYALALQIQQQLSLVNSPTVSQNVSRVASRVASHVASPVASPQPSPRPQEPEITPDIPDVQTYETIFLIDKYVTKGQQIIGPTTFHILDVKPDGTCLYASILLGLVAVGRVISSIRNEDELKNRLEELAMTLPGSIGETIRNNVDSRVQGDDETIKFFANAYNVNIYVYMDVPQFTSYNMKWHRFSPAYPDTEVGEKTIYLRWNGGHYVLLVPAQ